MLMTQESIDAFLQTQKENGASKDTLRQRKGFVTFLYRWLPKDKKLSKERLNLWRQDMQNNGYAKQTVLNYVKGINLYLDYMGWSDIRFQRGRAKDIQNLQFGYLTPIEPTGKNCRKDRIWRCACKCGKIVELPATRLLTGNTLSCGCMKAENILIDSKCIGGTQLVSSLKEDMKKTDTLSGYTGVAPKGHKWYAYITYRGKRYYLGTYPKKEDAIKARAKAKELVMEDARKLLEEFEAIHKNDRRPNRETLSKVIPQGSPDEYKKPKVPVITRTDNTSGHPGVFRKRDRWAARITYQKVTYQLGCFQSIDEAIAARKKAEQQLQKAPLSFVAEQKTEKESHNGNGK